MEVARLAHQGHVALVGHRAPGVAPLVEHVAQHDRWGCHRPGGPLGPGEGEQPVDQARQALHLVASGVEVLVVDGVVVLQHLQPQAQGGERRAQLVGGVGDELLLGGDELLQASGGGVERLGQLAHLGWAVGLVGAGVELAVADAGGGVAQVGDRAGDPAGEQDAEAAGDGEGDHGGGRQQCPVPVHAGVELVGRVRDADRPDGPAAGRHRDGDVDEPGSEGGGVARAGGDLRSRARAPRRSPGG